MYHKDMPTTIIFWLTFWLIFLVVCIRNLGLKWATIFILLSGGIGFIGEWLGINYRIFGAFYYYNSKLGPQLFGVPWVVLGYWATFIFGGMGVSNYFFKDNRSFWDAIFTLIIDFPLEITALKSKAWVWQDKFPPFANYLGWFLIALVVSYIFRSLNEKIFKSKIVVGLYVLLIVLLVA
jgi:uncharacterized membrane protein